MKRLIIAIFSLASVAASAQELNRNVEVVSDYTPLVERASKLSIMPVIHDTVVLQPYFDNTVQSRVWVSRFETAPIGAAWVLPSKYDHNRRTFYAKLGGGTPGQTLGDLYFTARSFGLYARHTGQWADIESVAAKTLLNNGGVFGRVYIGRSWTMGGELALTDNHYEDYLAGGAKRRWTMPEATLFVNSDIFSFEGEGWYLHQRSEYGSDITASVRKQIDSHIVHLTAGAQLSTINTVFTLTPQYELDNESVTFFMGARATYDNVGEKFRLLPLAELRVQGFVSPYVKLTGEIKDNSYRTLVAWNPYFDENFEFTTPPGATVKHALRGGVSGRIGHMVSWDVWAGGKIEKHTLLKSSIEPLFVDKIEAYGAGVDIEAKANYLVLSVSGKYLKYNELEDYFPALEASGTVSYFRKKWAAHLGADLTDEYNYYGSSTGLYGTEKRVPIRADIRAQVDYNIGKHFGIFVSGANLLDRKLYPHPLHGGVGATFSAGIKIKG